MKFIRILNKFFKEVPDFDLFFEPTRRSIETHLPRFVKHICSQHGICYCENCLKQFNSVCDHYSEESPLIKTKKTNQLLLVLDYIKHCETLLEESQILTNTNRAIHLDSVVKSYILPSKLRFHVIMPSNIDI